MFSLISQPFFPENLRGLFYNKKPTSTKHLLCHRLYIIKRVLLKMYIPKYAFVHIFFVWSRAFLPQIVYSVKTMFKSVFLVNTLHARTRVWAISLPVLYINVLYINAPPPHPEYVYMHSVQHELKLLYHKWRRWLIQNVPLTARQPMESM